MRVLGLDPGLRVTGWGVIDSQGSTVTHVANGNCRPLGHDLGERLASLFAKLSAVVDEFRPDAAAVEKTFVNNNFSGSLVLGHARAVAILSASRNGISVGEYTPNSVKKAVTGVGHAEKQQVESMVSLQLPGAIITGSDAADALAVALAHVVACRFGRALELAIARAGAEA